MGLALPKLLKSGLWRGQGATGRSVVAVCQKNKFPKKTGAIYRIRPPQKALFRGVWDLVLVPPNGKPALGETPGHLGGRMRTRTCHGTSQIVAENVMRSTKNAKTAKPPMTSCEVVPSENGTTKLADFRYVAGPGYNRTISNRGSPQAHIFLQNWGYL